MKILFIGGTGEISYACLHAAANLGHRIYIFNRGHSTEPLPPSTTQILGDLADDAAYARLADQRWDAVCQFKAYTPDDITRDLRTFAGKIGQYLFISSASVYQKPPLSYVFTEDHPIGNQYWSYSQQKADMESALLAAHNAGQLPVTIVRPSHTYRRIVPSIVFPGDEAAWRLLHHQPIIIHGDGTSLWTYTHADDFAAPFVRLLGNPKALGQAFHLTNHLHAYTWNQIFTAWATALGAAPNFVHIPTDTLIRLAPDLLGNLLGDKAWPSLFDNSKIHAVVGKPAAPIPLAQGLAQAAPHVRARLQHHHPDPATHAFWDHIISAQCGITG